MSTPWYEQISDIHSANERDEFVKGMYGIRPNSQHTFLVGLLAGYFGTKYATKAIFKKSRYDSR
jgi:hypothetical protein